MKTLVAVVLLAVLAAAGFVASGWYDAGADRPHWEATYRLLQFARERSVAQHAKDLVLPDNLDDEATILEGAGQYAAMCTGCHLAPGMDDSELRPGLYPQPPDLSRTRVDPRAAFWTIKHGIKMSVMPAWGGSHDDATIWSMVAFLRRLPGLSPAGYAALVAKAPPDGDMESRGHGDRHAAGAPAPMADPSRVHRHPAGR
ncbi:cytochrome C [Frateuria sp. Soil773]|uniref:c-type cytochrome n=1 Tax=Frateuria sp. Soil773 TaxID=1736407 RepID=UPI000700E070|nr:cytochrome c [Frateuria sp. Soil773]KRE89366.1 cytochrome C [Frateuria sp. Soil773]